MTIFVICSGESFGVTQCVYTVAMAMRFLSLKIILNSDLTIILPVMDLKRQ